MEIKKKGASIDAIPTDEAVFPCPFCGSEDIQLQHTWTAAYWVECGGCGAEVSGESYPDDQNENGHILAAKSAIEAWQKRTHRQVRTVPLKAGR